jgi:iron(III) transport system permease protein
MVRWRVAVAALLMAIVGWPLIMPLVALLADPSAWSAWRDAPRILELARTTAALVGGVLAVDIPLGILLAILLYRSDLPGRTFLRRVVVVSLFVPLPLLTSAWQAALGSGGWLGRSEAGYPWATGLRAAIWVHAAAGLPWVIWLVGQGLCWVEPEAEDDARLAVGPWRVLMRVTLPRASGAILAAAAWVALLTAQDITVTDMTKVRTFAEEVYTQFVLPDPGGGFDVDAGVDRAVAVTVPWTILVALVLGLAVWRCEQVVPPLGSAPDPRPLVRLGPMWALTAAAVVLVIGAFFAVPVASLVWKLGLHGYPEQWSAVIGTEYLKLAARAHAGLIAGSLIAAATAGVLAATLALLGCWLARDSRAIRVMLTALVALAWATPGPVVGAGLKTAINELMDIEEWVTPHGPIRVLFYNGPSPMPVIWAYVVRFVPCAVALLWPAVRLVPAALTDMVRVDGTRPGGELRYAIWPVTAAAAGRAAVAAGVLALGELSASKLVATPGDHTFGETFAHVVWTRMHYGVANHLAAMCLLLLVVAIVPTLLLAVVRRRRSGYDSSA